MTGEGWTARPAPDDATLGLRLRAWLAYTRAVEKRIESGPGLSAWQQAYAEAVGDLEYYVVEGYLEDFLADNDFNADLGDADPEPEPIRAARAILEAAP